MMKRTIRIQSSRWGLMLYCLLGSHFLGFAQIDFQEIKEMNDVFPEEGRMETADVDNDGDLDILSMGRTKNDDYEYATKLLLNDGDGNFSPVENTVFDSAFAGDAEFGDVDSDGDLDVIVVGQENWGGYPTGKLYLNQGNAIFTVASSNPFPAVQDSHVRFFDFNGDPHLDVLISGSTGLISFMRITKIFTGDGRGNFEEVPDHGLRGLAMADASFGDINGDGTEELVFAGASLERDGFGVYVYEKVNGKYVERKKLTTLYGGGAELADLDMDGDLDYLVTGYSSYPRVEYFKNDGNGGFSKVYDKPFLDGAKLPIVVVEDFDLDGDPDVFIGGPNGEIPQNYLYLNDGAGGFTINTYQFPKNTKRGNGVGNFDGKGFSDFLFFGVEKGKATFYFNNIDLNEPPVVSNVTIVGESLVEYVLEANYSFQDKEDGKDNSSFQWYVADDDTGANRSAIVGANLKTYKISHLDKGKYLNIEITPKDESLSGTKISSGWVGPVAAPVSEIVVSGNSIPIINGSFDTSSDNHTDFGNESHSKIQSRTFSLGNKGKADLIIEGILLQGENKEDFSLVVTQALPIVPGAKMEFTIEFSPTGLGNRIATVSIYSNDTQNSPYTFAISGVGQNSPPLMETAPLLNFEENSKEGVFDFQASDGEGGPADQNIRYSISGGEDMEFFIIDSETGNLEFFSPRDFEQAEDSNGDNYYQVEITADDGENENNTTKQVINVGIRNVDELPVAVCREGIVISLDTNGKATLTAEMIDGGSTDDIGIKDIKVEPSQFDCSNIGDVEVFVTVEDTGGNFAQCSTSITVVDDITPVISPVSPVTVSSEIGNCATSISIVPPRVLDNCGSWDAIGTRSDELLLTEPFPIGKTRITWRIDDSDMGEEVVQEINVLDVEPPVIGAVLPFEANTDANSNGAYLDIEAPTVSDCGETKITGRRKDGLELKDKFPVGETIITWSATDGPNNAEPVEQKIIIKDNEKPVIEMPNDISIISKGGNCGALVNVPSPLVKDNCGVSGIPGGTREDNQPMQAIFPVGDTRIKWTAVDVNNNHAIEVYQNITVLEKEPDQIQITGPESPQIIGTTIEMSAAFTAENFVKAVWKILDGGKVVQAVSESLVDPGSRKVSQNFEGISAGVYTVSLDLIYDCGKVENRNFEYLVIYDPNGGFVTGGGWIYSPEGAMKDPEMATRAGKASFGFNAKYKSGKNELYQVDGETSFQFKAGDLFFKSDSHEAMSLIVSGGFKATYKGIGSINGENGFKFMVSVIDADKTQNYQQDLFRIKIWKEGMTVYDNNLRDEAENADPATAIEGGSIVIHNPNTNKTSSVEATPIGEQQVSPALQIFSAYPNPMETSAIIEFMLDYTTEGVLSLFDLNGREVQNLFSGRVEKGNLYRFEVERKNLMDGIYFYRLSTGAGVVFQKQLIMK